MRGGMKLSNLVNKNWEWEMSLMMSLKNYCFRQWPQNFTDTKWMDTYKFKKLQPWKLLKCLFVSSYKIQAWFSRALICEINFWGQVKLPKTCFAQICHWFGEVLPHELLTRWLVPVRAHGFIEQCNPFPCEIWVGFKQCKTAMWHIFQVCFALQAKPWSTLYVTLRMHEGSLPQLPRIFIVRY